MVAFALGAGWALVSSKEIPLKCRTNDDRCQPGWVGSALAFLALYKVGFVSGFSVHRNVLKIAWYCVGKVMDA